MKAHLITRIERCEVEFTLADLTKLLKPEAERMLGREIVVSHAEVDEAGVLLYCEWAPTQNCIPITNP
jgi:hypothetical protein